MSIPDQLALLGVLVLFNVFSPAIALIVLWARPQDGPARLLGLGVLAFAPYGLLYMWDKAVGQTLDPQWHWYAVILAQRVTLLTQLHLLLSFPVVHPWLARLQALGPTWLRRLGGGTGLLYAVPIALTVKGLPALFSEPLALLSLEPPAPDALKDPIALLLWGIMLFVLVYRYRDVARPAARGALIWMGFGLGMGWAVLTFSNNSINALIGVTVQPIAEPVKWAAFLIQPSALGLAMVRYRLFEVSPFVRTALVYPLVLGILIGGYDLVAGVVGRVATSLLGPEITTNPLIAALPLLVIVGLLRPLRRRLQGVLERSLQRAHRARTQLLEDAAAAFARPRPPHLVASFLMTHAAERLTLTGAWLVSREPVVGVLPAPAPVEPLLEHLAHAVGPVALVQVGQEAKPAGVDALVAEGPGLAEWYRLGARVLIPLRAPAMGVVDGMSGETLVGAWAVGERRSDEPFDEEDLAVLAHVGQLAAFQLDYARLAASVAQHPPSNPAVRRLNEATA
jgi:hypothetical protein